MVSPDLLPITAICIDAVALNAGLQVVTGATRTPDGFETTFRVNHLAQLLLLDALLARSEPPARVVLTGWGTHDPSRRSGMPAPLEGDVGSWARADPARDPGAHPRRADPPALAGAGFTRSG